MVLFFSGLPVLTENFTNSNSKEKCVEKCETTFNETDKKLQQTKTDSYRDADESKTVALQDCSIEADKEYAKCAADYASETNKCSNQWYLAGSLNEASYKQAVANASFSYSYGIMNSQQMAVATNSAANKLVGATLEATAQYQKCIWDRGGELSRCKNYAKSNYDSCCAKAENNARRSKYAADVAYRVARYTADEVRQKCLQDCNPSS